ncbi:hypothetical protein JOC95_003433 [Bacillus tianshenii]|uniref:Uncharacterized protein n=1 Tax=Sutcliffiella tianshenii TaxID=1463404 RepID=A0ABS2P3U7_9BACI|nr:hypothetical protein [Bacillus tianshenii]
MNVHADIASACFIFTEYNIEKTDRFPLYFPNIYVARFIISINLGKYLRIE